MIVLCCPQCQTKLPVPEEKLGTKLFVCPSCTFPLEASNQTADAGEVTAAYLPNNFVANLAPPPRLSPLSGIPTPPPAPRPAPPPAAVQAVPKEAKVKKPGRKTAAPAPSRAVEPAKTSGGRVWLVGGVCVLGTAVLAGVLYVTVNPGLTLKGKDDEQSKQPKLGMLEVLALSKDLQDGDAETRREAAMKLGEAGSEARVALAFAPGSVEGR